MQKFVILTLVISGAILAHPVDSNTFRHLVCQQCNSWCSAVQGIPEGPTRIGKAGPRGAVGRPGPPAVVNMTEIEELIDRKIKEALLQSEETDTTRIPKTTTRPIQLVTAQSCRNIPLDSAKSRNETGGVFDINIPGLGKREVYCDVTTDGGNWIVFQRRMDGSVDFYRDWNDYVNGFGSTSGEFWLGLEAIHQLTKTGRHELRIDMIDTNGNRHYAKYSSFRIGPASDNYRLNVSGYSGNTTYDSMNYHNNMKFTTRDRNDGGRSANCATEYHGAWWYNNCHYSNLNGQYGVTSLKGMRFHGAGTNYMRFTEMKIRQKQ